MLSEVGVRPSFASCGSLGVEAVRPPAAKGEAEKPPATISLMVSAAKNRRHSLDIPENEPLAGGDDRSDANTDNSVRHKLYSLRNLLNRGSSTGTVWDDSGMGSGAVAPEGIARFRQLFAIRIIERHYTRHVRVRPAQLYLDAARTKRAEWGRLTFATSASSKSGGHSYQTSRTKTSALYMRVSHASEAGRVARCIAKYAAVFSQAH